MTEPRPAPDFGPLALVGDEAAATLDGQIAAVHRLGWHTLELRNVAKRPLAEHSRDEVRDLAARLRDARVRVISLASRIGNWARPVTGDFEADLAELDILLEHSDLLGSRMIRVMSYPNDGLSEDEWGYRVTARMSRLAARAAAAGATLLHENCAGWAGDSAPRTLQLLHEVDSPALRVLFDTGNGVPHGYDAEKLLEPLLPHVAHVHIKDAARTPDGSTAYTLPGDGSAHLTRCLDMLAHSGYRGALSLEPHLAIRPHDGHNQPGADATGLTVQAGERLEELLRDMRPAAPAAPAPAAPAPAESASAGPSAMAQRSTPSDRPGPST